jgi:tRNA(Ile)-lysidine synthetase-like protein
MPIRHFATVDSLRALLALVSRWEAEVETGSSGDAALLKRYRRATQRRLDVLCDQGKRDGRILAQEEGVPAYSDVEQQLPREMLVRAVDKFVRSHVLVQGTAVVSLSGGVDSMVLCQVLCYLRDYPHLSHPASSPALTHTHGSRDVSGRGPARAGVGGQGSPHDRRETDGDATGVDARILHTVAAVHVDYGNRCESGEEASFLEAWCRARGIKWFSTRAQVQRGAGDREAYEAETRDLRFALYRSALDATGARGVMLGHHRGDVEENVISNAMKGASVLALGGMHPVQYMSQFKVEIQRPLLAMDKVEILDFAARYSVPYFKDTTPSWSTRGRLRRKLIPLLQDVYGDGVLSKMSSLAAEADELNSLLQMSVFAPFHAAVIEGSAGACVTRESFDVYVDYPIAFWKLVLRHVCLRAGAEVPREGSVKQMIDRQRKALGRQRYQLASALGERGKLTRRGGHSGGQLSARANGSGIRDRSSQPGDIVAEGQAEDGQGEDRMGRDGEMRATWLQARQHSRTLLYAGGLYILNPALFPASPGGGDGVWWHRGQRLIVGRFYLLGPWNVTLALLPVDECVASRDVEDVEKCDIKQHGRECIGRASGSSGGSGESVNEGEERQGGYRPGVAMTMMDVVKGLLVYELPLMAWRGEDEAEKVGGDGDCESGVVAWKIEPFARIAACRLIPREVRALLPIVAPVGAPTTQQQERLLSHQAGVSHVVSGRRGGRARERTGGDGDAGASLEDTFRDSLARVLSVRRSPGPPTPERGGGHERRNGRTEGSEHLRGKSDGIGRRMGESRESSESSGVDTELEAGTHVEAGRGDWARRKVRVTLRALSTQ